MTIYQGSRGRIVEHKSAITDRNNCIIDREGAKVIHRESNRKARWVKEAIWIKTTSIMNQDEGDIDLVTYGAAYQVNWRAEEVVVPEFLMKVADDS